MTIKIPTWMNPYTVEINGQKYSYPAGEEVDVPDAVAEIIQRDIDVRKEPQAPVRLGNVAALVMTHTSDPYFTANMTPAQVADLLISGVPVVCLNTFESTGEQSAGFVTYYPGEHTITSDTAGIPTVSADATDWNSY